jgi:deazaflavin-dependent oxidoreductase (nitroreductase family)
MRRRSALIVSRILQGTVRFFNPVARFILSSRLHAVMSGRVALLTFTGRKTGRSYTTPVSYVREGSSLLIPGGGGWWKNLGSGRPSRVLLQGTWHSVTPELVSAPNDLAMVLQRMLAANPAISIFIGVSPGPGGHPDPEALERERRRGFVVVRLRLDAERGLQVTDVGELHQTTAKIQISGTGTG